MDERKDHCLVKLSRRIRLTVWGPQQKRNGTSGQNGQFPLPTYACKGKNIRFPEEKIGSLGKDRKKKKSRGEGMTDQS